MIDYPALEQWVSNKLMDGQVIPALPLALNPDRTIDNQHQVALIRYYHAAGAGGLAVAVHTTQFSIRRPEFNLLIPILSLASKTIDEIDDKTGRKTIKINGVCGNTEQAIIEAKLGVQYGYHASLLSLSALKNAAIDQLIDHCRQIAKITPLIGFYLQPAIGGIELTYEFWREFFEIPNVVAAKIAPFNRYQTIDVIRALAESGNYDRIALYTGNDDNIIIDLLTEFIVDTSKGPKRIRINGGLLGHWAIWTQKSVNHLNLCKSLRNSSDIPANMLTLAAQITEANAAVFDAKNKFHGVIAGIHEVLKEQGLMKHNICLDSNETLSEGQLEEIERVRMAYPHLLDDNFIASQLGNWLEQ